MNKLVLVSLIASVAAAPFAAFANDPVVTAPASPAANAVHETAAAVAVKPVEAELKDGTKIEITGEKVEVVGKDGKKTPAPDAEHTLKDGTKVTTKGGMIVKK